MKLLPASALWILTGVMAAFCSCAASRNPVVSQVRPLSAMSLADTSQSTGWDLNSLSPAEGTVLTDRRKTDVSVQLTASGTFSYFVSMSANNKAFRPFIASSIAGNGQANLSVKVTWLIKSKGKLETIVVRLYMVDLSPSGQTKTVTLLGQIMRNYNVVCDQKKCWLIRFFRVHIFCSCQNPS